MPLPISTGNAILDKLLRDNNFTFSATHISLHTADPEETGLNEVEGGEYARQEITFTAPDAKTTENAAVIDFTDMPAVTVTHFALWSASTEGTFVWAGELAASKVVNAGDTFRFAAGSVEASLT